MTDVIKRQQRAEEKTNPAQSCREGHTFDTSSGTESRPLEFNRYLYENLMSNVECQLEYWNRKADHETNHEAAHALRLKAEGLGYALRLLNAFEPEFRELTDCASRAATDEPVQR